MTDNTNAPAPNARHEDDRRVDGAGSVVAIHRRSSPDACGQRPVWPVKEQPDRRWPFKAADVVPLQWWRTLPSDALRDAEQSLMLTTLDRIGVLHPVDDLKAALAGDAAAAISMAFSMMPIEKTTLAIDIGMTALCRCALARHAASALVMAQVIGLTNFDHGLSIELAMSWYRHGLRYASDPRRFRDAETVLLKAFHELDRSGSR